MRLIYDDEHKYETNLKNGGIEMKYISIALDIASAILSIFTICYILRRCRNSKETEA